MVVPWIYDAVAKSHLIWLNAKNSPFLHFLVSLRKKISSARRSDNIDASGPAHSSFWTLCPKFCKKIFILMTLLIFGSQQAPKSVDPDSCHSKKLFFRQTNKSNLLSSCTGLWTNLLKYPKHLTLLNMHPRHLQHTSNWIMGSWFLCPSWGVIKLCKSGEHCFATPASLPYN